MRRNLFPKVMLLIAALLGVGLIVYERVKEPAPVDAPTIVDSTIDGVPLPPPSDTSIIVSEESLGTLPDPREAIVIDPQVPWWESNWAHKKTTQQVARVFDRDRETTHFRVNQPNRNMVWCHYFARPIDWHQYPIITMRYRATGSQGVGQYLIWVDDGDGPNHGGRSVWQTTKHLVRDGNVRELQADLRTLNLGGDGYVTGLALGLCTGSIPTDFELIDIRFKVDPYAVDDASTDMPMQPASNNLPSPDQLSSPHAVHVLVVDENDKPVHNAMVTIDAERLNEAVTIETNAEGHAHLMANDSASELQYLRVSKHGMTTIWLRYKTDTLTDQPIKVTMLPTNSASGIIVDEDDNPVAEAMVLISSHFDAYAKREAGRRWQPPSRIRLLTDEQGRFTHPALPVTDKEQRSIYVMHHAYLQTHRYGQALKADAAELYTNNAKITIERGLTIAGYVTDADGTPIPNVKLFHIPNHRTLGHTDDFGYFECFGLPEGDTPLIIQAPNYATKFHAINLTSSIENLNFKMTPSKPIHFQVIDVNGNPIPQAHVHVGRWGEDYAGSMAWVGSTNAQGNITWKDPPDHPQLYYSHAEGFKYQLTEHLTPGDDVNQITLLDPVKLVGEVVDDATSKPINSYTITVGHRHKNESQFEWHKAGELMQDSKFEKTLTTSHDFYKIRIEADGFQTFESKPFAAQDHNATFHVRLMPPK